MSDRFDPGQLGDWVLFCDICGQKCYASESHKLSTYTGRGGLVVCKNDVDKIDYGLVPYKAPTEENVPWTRVNHLNTDNGAPIPNLEASSVEQISNYQYLLISQEPEGYIVMSQDENALIAVNEEV